MGNSINISILIPLLPMVAALLVFILLVSFNRTINRLTKPVTFIIGISLLGSAFISSYYYFKRIEGELVLSDYFKFFQATNLVIHVNLFIEKFLIFFSLIMAILIGLAFYKLPRKKGYVSLMISIAFICSSAMLSIMLIDFSALA